MSLSSEINGLRSRVRALKRKLARPLAELRLQRMAGELCLEWTCAQADRQPFPNADAIRPKNHGNLEHHKNHSSDDNQKTLLIPGTPLVM